MRDGDLPSSTFCIIIPERKEDERNADELEKSLVLLHLATEGKHRCFHDGWSYLPSCERV